MTIRATSTRYQLRFLLAFVTTMLLGISVDAQQIAVSTPFSSARDSFYENHGVSFGFGIPGGQGPGSRVVGYGIGGLTPNINFNQGGSSSAIPPFGGFDPNSSARFGISSRGRNGGGFNLGLTLGKGSSRSVVSTVPGVVVQNGFGGSITSGQFTPFVTGVTPVVGNRGNFQDPDNAVTRAINSGQLDLRKPTSPPTEVETKSRIYSDRNSSAQSGDFSVAAIKAARQQAIIAKQQEMQAHIDKASSYVEAGKYRDARRSFREAIKLCDDDRQKKLLKKKVAELKGL